MALEISANRGMFGQTAVAPVEEFRVRLSECSLPKLPGSLENILRNRNESSRAHIKEMVEVHERETTSKRAALISNIKNELNAEGLKGRYVIPDNTFLRSDQDFLLIANTAEVIKHIRSNASVTSVASVSVPECSGSLRQYHNGREKPEQLLRRITVNQLWESTIPPLQEVRFRFKSKQLDAVFEKLESFRGECPRDKRLALIEEANSARRAALGSIRRYLKAEGLGRRFVIPSSQWDGTGDFCSIIGMAPVRVTLVQHPEVTLVPAMRRTE